MTYEIRHGATTFKGAPHDVRGSVLKVGDTAPDFQLTANDHSTKTLQDFAGKVKLISVVPSLDTGICDAQTRRFNQEASDLGENVVILTVSADLPFAQKRWCGAAGVDRVLTLSTHKDMQFSDAYGVHDITWRVNQRSIFVLDANDKITYVEYIPEIASHVNYDAALEAVKQTLS
jgi:thiol peroxidase